MSDAAAVLTAEISANPEKLIAGFQRAERATSAWAAAAERHMQTAQASFNGVDFTVVTSKAKAEQLKLIELQHQLDVARAAGEKRTVVALGEEIAMLQKVRQLRAAGLKEPEAASAARASLAAVAAAREEAEARELAARRAERIRGKPSEALANVFANTRLGVIEEGSTKVPIFGAALEGLGAAGLAAAAGLATAALAAEEVRKAMEFAEDIEKASKTLGVTTTYLQTFDEASIAVSIGQDKARESLQQFNEVFGKYSAGLANSRSAKFLNALGYTPETARQIGDVGSALDKTLLKLAELKNPQQRASLANQLGLANFLPVLTEGTEGVQKFLDAMQAAEKSGSIISPEQIRQAAELNDKLEVLEHRIGNEFKAAFIDAAPAIEKVAEFIERCTHALSGFIGEIPDAIKGLSLFNNARGAAGDAATGGGSPGGAALDNLRKFVLLGPLGAPIGLGQRAFRAAAKRGRRLNLQEGVARLASGNLTDADREGLKGLKDEYENAGQTPGADLAPPHKPKKTRSAPADPEPGLRQQGQQDLDTSQKALDEAQAALTSNIQARADFQLKALKDEEGKRQDELDAQIDKIKATKGLTQATKQALIAQREQASDLADAAYQAKAAKVRRDAEQAQARQDLQDASAQLQLHDRILSAEASTATSARARANLEEEILRDQQAIARETEQQRIAARRAGDSGYAAAQARRDQSDFDAAQKAELIAHRTQAQRQINPLYARAHPATSFGDDLQGVEAKGLDSMTDTLTQLITQSANAKEAFHNLISSMVADLARLLIQRDIEGPLANLLFGKSPQNNMGNLGATRGTGIIGTLVTSLFGLPGHASGSDGFSGLTRINEGGPEGVAFLPKNTQIIPNDTLRGLARLTPDRLGSGAMTVNHHINIDLTGANGDQAIRDIAYTAAAQGSAHAISTSRNDLRKSQTAGRRSLLSY